MKNHPDLPENSPQWLRDADIERPHVTIDEYGVVHWQYGEWHDGVWRGGEWHDGEWQYGVWQYGEWRGGEWRDGVWRGGEWRGGVWHDGEWHDGEWHGGDSSPTRCRWKVLVTDGRITIGCKTKTVEEWDAWFASTEQYETKRGTEAFRLIHRAYMAARAAAIFDQQ